MLSSFCSLQTFTVPGLLMVCRLVHITSRFKLTLTSFVKLTLALLLKLLIRFLSCVNLPYLRTCCFTLCIHIFLFIFDGWNQVQRGKKTRDLFASVMYALL